MAYPVMLRDTEPAAHLLTIYCVQAYWFDGRKPAHGALKECATEERALALGRRLSRRHYGVMVFSVTGNPEADYWRSPKVLKTYGVVPAVCG